MDRRDVNLGCLDAFVKLLVLLSPKYCSCSCSSSCLCTGFPKSGPCIVSDMGWKGATSIREGKGLGLLVLFYDW